MEWGHFMLVAALLLAQSTDWHSFENTQLSEGFFSEGAGTADFDGDGHGDIVSGPFVYFGPDFEVKTEVYEPAPFSIQGYSDSFFAFPHDIDGDGFVDLLAVGFPGQEAFWYRNPGGEIRGAEHWERSLVLAQVDNESPQFEDINADGNPDLVCMTGGALGWAEWDPANPKAAWTFHAVSSPDVGGRFTHGLGIGDVDGDGRQDLLMKQGWWTQPENSREAWAFTAFTFAQRGGAQMYAYDIDGDGDSDVVTSENAHGYGLVWFENIAAEEGAKEPFQRHVILGSLAEENEHSVVIGNLHALDLVDMDGDGLLDLVTGARFWAHGGNDIADHEPAFLYWFRLQRTTAGAEFIPFLIDEDSGVGTQVIASDINGDGLPEVIVGNKKGTFVHHHAVEPVAESEYRDRLLQAILANKNRITDNRPDGVFATNADGVALNLGFETGDLSDWTATGEAFRGQPIQGDTIAERMAPNRSRHDGEFWIGTYEVDGDAPTGSLTSVAFEVTHPLASFLIGGGSHDDTCVQILAGDSDRVLFQSQGKDNESMRARWLDLRAHFGTQIRIRLLDNNSGGWGHINFDGFLFHAETEENLNRALENMPSDMVEGFPPEDAAARMTLLDGFHTDLIAGEPDLHQPIAMTFDSRGRIWVAEAYSYPERRAEGEGEDHILVFEDTNNDGTFDKRTVFLDNLNLVSGLEVGFGGVWVGAAPYLMFVPDADADLVPDGEPQILLDGWGYQDTHETLNAFNWGPDGWLYGCQGVFTHSRVGKPGTPDELRTPMNAGVWRYHPTRNEFEVFAWGSSNPWGVDFDDRGQAVITACVIPHLYHVIQGARYIRQGGSHFNPFVFGDIETIADHLHYLGATPHSGNGSSDSVGGGHAHCGAAIYLADQFPSEFRNRLFLFNVHGKRINSEFLAPSGSGLVGTHAPDFALANDKWFLGVSLRVGPDGSLFFVDWYDEQACHRSEVEIWDRSNGRLYRTRFGELKPVAADVASKSSADLVALQLHPNDWFVRQARRILMERGPDEAIAASLFAHLQSQEQTEKRLRFLWALHAVDGLTPERVSELLGDADEYVRAWTIQLAIDQVEGKRLGGTSKTLPLALQATLDALAEFETSLVVRLYLASAMQRMEIQARRKIATALMSQAENADDHNLPLMIWYGYEPFVGEFPGEALADIQQFNAIPLLADFTYRRLAHGESAMLDTLCQAIAGAELPLASEMIRELSAVLESRPGLAMPASWPGVSQRFLRGTLPGISATTTDQVGTLALGFGDVTVAPQLRNNALDSTLALERRVAALDGLVQVLDPELNSVLLSLLADNKMRAAALDQLALTEDPSTPGVILGQIQGFSPAEQARAADMLATRASYATEFLQAVLKGTVPRELLNSAPLRLRLTQLGESTIDDLLTSAWGRSSISSEEVEEQKAKYTSLLTPEYVSGADLPNGRALFRETCWACHDLFGDGLPVGPGLTGSNRADLDYILSNILDPSAEVGREYLMTTVTMNDGRVISGMVVDENNETITLQTGATIEVLPKGRMGRDQQGNPKVARSAFSMMPPGQLQRMGDTDIRDLIGYLASPVQVPEAMTKAALPQFFNGRDLTRWIADPEVWFVEDGELVGRSTTGLAANKYASSDFLLEDFRLTLEVKLADNTSNSGVQFRSRRTPSGDMIGPQADIGAEWWGKLYEVGGRNLMGDVDATSFVRQGQWNTYEIVATGNRFLTALNGNVCVDQTDELFAKRGVVGFQVHAGEPTEVRFRNLKLELNPEPILVTVE